MSSLPTPALIAETIASPARPEPLRRPPAGALAWLRRGEGFVGIGEAWRFEASGPDRFEACARAFQELAKACAVVDPVRVPGSGLIAFGSFAFADDSSEVSRLIVPQHAIGVRDEVWFETRIAPERGPLPAAGSGSAAGASHPAFAGQRARAPQGHVANSPAPGDGVEFRDGPVGAGLWPGRVGDAIAAIKRGEVDKVVLARAVDAIAPRPIDVGAVLSFLAEQYPACWTFAVDSLAGATPELLVRTQRGLVTSRVLAGTIRRTGLEAQDLARAAQLAHSSKDLEEHEFAVRSVAQALAPHCDSINVPESPYVLHLPNVMHLATDVTGVLADGLTSLDLAGRLHPSAAVCGTPREAAAALIARLEGADRGRYSGPVGWLGADGDGEWAIALRCAQFGHDTRTARLFAGGGIVAASDPYAELAETESKLVPMRAALTAATAAAAL